MLVSFTFILLCVWREARRVRSLVWGNLGNVWTLAGLEHMTPQPLIHWSPNTKPNNNCGNFPIEPETDKNNCLLVLLPQTQCLFKCQYPSSVQHTRQVQQCRECGCIWRDLEPLSFPIPRHSSSVMSIIQESNWNWNWKFILSSIYLQYGNLHLLIFVR
jgi:hypothetical protein